MGKRETQREKAIIRVRNWEGEREGTRKNAKDRKVRGKRENRLKCSIRTKEKGRIRGEGEREVGRKGVY